MARKFPSSRLERHYPETILALEQAERYLVAAAGSGREGDQAARTAHLGEAAAAIRLLLERRERMWQDLVATWERSRYPRNLSVGGRDRVDIGSDVKVGFAGRRTGLEYLIAPFQRMGLEGWLAELEKSIKQAGDQH